MTSSGVIKEYEMRYQAECPEHKQCRSKIPPPAIICSNDHSYHYIKVEKTCESKVIYRCEYSDTTESYCWNGSIYVKCGRNIVRESPEIPDSSSARTQASLRKKHALRKRSRSMDSAELNCGTSKSTQLFLEKELPTIKQVKFPSDSSMSAKASSSSMDLSKVLTIDTSSPEFRVPEAKTRCQTCGDYITPEDRRDRNVDPVFETPLSNFTIEDDGSGEKRSLDFLSTYVPPKS